MNRVTICEATVKIIAGFLVLLALFCAKRAISLDKKIISAELEQKLVRKKNAYNICLTVISILFAALAFFVPAVKEIQSTYIVENNQGAIFNGSVGEVNIVYGEIGGGKTFPNGKREEEASITYEEVKSWTVGWADSIGGRRDYTLQEVNEGVLNHKIVFNSISDSVIGHEFNFVGARENNGVNNGFNGNEIEAEKGKTYVVRIYAHNNSPLGEEDAAYNVSERFEISEPKHVIGNDVALEGFDSSNGYYSVAVHGYIMVPNQEITWYSDGVKFVSNRPFHLEYVKGTALFENNEIGNAEHQGYRLSDDIIGDGVLIGYDAMDGRVPACYQYSSYTSIVVMPVFE